MSYISWMHKGKLPREQVGGKGASLSDMMAGGFRVPGGFCVTAEGYRHFVESAGIKDKIAELITSIDTTRPGSVREAAGLVTDLVSDASLPHDLSQEIADAYDGLCAMSGTACAVRSSAISEDGSAASFAGLYESYLNVRGINEVLDAVHRCFVSLWSERAVDYRARRGGGADEAMAVVVMGLVPSETSGIAFTAHPVTGALNMVVINASFGLGEAIVSGRVTPDSFVISKDTFQIVERDIFPKEVAVYPHPDGGGTVERQIDASRQRQPSLSDEMACEVARLAAKVEKHYGAPQDVEWGLVGGDLFLLQSRPITTLG
jgi:phosphoenolpyruvate synthase/pyruvate phosphate dikinase